MSETCRRCGANVAPDALNGLCPQCLLGGIFTEDAPQTELAEAEEAREEVVTADPLAQSHLDGSIGRFKRLRLLGEGGMGEVYLAEQTEPVDRLVALKVLKPGLETKQVIRRFEAERQALAIMDHPYIAHVYDGGVTSNGMPYFAMEYVEGEPITDFCDHHRFDTPQRLSVFRCVCQAIQHAHQKGVIHRDIKPSNILVGIQDGVAVPKVIDFGLAKATDRPLVDKTMFTEAGMVLGTPAYMSPEQASLNPLAVDTRSDLYGLGVLLYELLTGKPPFDIERLRSSAWDEVCRIIREEEPPKPSTRIGIAKSPATTAAARKRNTDGARLIRQVRGDLDWITLKAMEKDPERRYQSVRDLENDVECYLGNEPVSASPPSVGYRVRKFVRRNRLSVGFAATILILLLGGTVASTLFALQARESERNAKLEADQSQEIVTLLKDMLDGVGPAVALGRDTTILHEILDKTKERMDSDQDLDPEIEAAIKQILGGVYFELGDRDESEKVRRESLAIQRELMASKARRQDFHNVAADLNNLSQVLIVKQQYQEAAEMAQEALEIIEANFGGEFGEDDFGDYTAPLNHYAVARLYLGHHDEAEKTLREVLDLEKQLHGENHQEVANAHNTLGYALTVQKRHAEAETEYRKAIALWEKLLGEEHPHVLAARNNLAQLLSSRDDPDREQAEKLQRGVVEGQKEMLGKDHPEFVQSLESLAEMLRKNGQLDEAAAKLEEALAIQTKALGEPHPGVGALVHKLASMQWDLGRVNIAASLYQGRFNRLKGSQGDEDSSTVAAGTKLYEFYRRVGDRQRAESLQRWLMMRPVFFEQASIECMQMAFNLHILGDREKYVSLCQKILDLKADTDDTTAAECAGRGVLIDPEASKEMVTKAAALIERALDLAADNPWAGATLGLARVRQGQYEEALAILDQALEKPQFYQVGAFAHAIKSLAHYHLDQPDRCQKEMLLAEQIVGSASQAEPKEGAPSLTPSQGSWLIIRETRKHLTGESAYDVSRDPSIASVLVRPDSLWKWHHPVNGIDPADADADFHTTFMNADFDDAAWKEGRDSQGPLGGFGYGQGQFNGVSIGLPLTLSDCYTAYFRHRFTTDEKRTRLELRCQMDDGIIVYLDGREVLRDNIPEGPESYRLHAVKPMSGGAEYRVRRYRIPHDLRAGDHVLAISLHNRGGGSGDLRIAGITLGETPPDQ